MPGKPRPSTRPAGSTARLGDYQSALACCTRAFELVEATGHRYNLGNVWDTFGYMHHQLGDHSSAVACFEQAVTLLREFGARNHLADSLDRLGDAQLASARVAAAHKSWHEALALLEELAAPEADAVRRKLSAQDHS